MRKQLAIITTGTALVGACLAPVASAHSPAVQTDHNPKAALSGGATSRGYFEVDGHRYTLSPSADVSVDKHFGGGIISFHDHLGTRDGQGKYWLDGKLVYRLSFLHSKTMFVEPGLSWLSWSEPNDVEQNDLYDMSVENQLGLNTDYWNTASEVFGQLQLVRGVHGHTTGSIYLNGLDIDGG